MLQSRFHSTIEATLPVLAERLPDIAGAFYRKIFTAHPELLDGLFNRGNQRSGEQRQALAGSILGYARGLLDQTIASPHEPLDPVLERIAHKHVSLGVRPEQYPIVYRYLFEAIAEDLGDLLTAQITEAWTEVYWIMAERLITREHELYERQDVQDVVWAHWRVAQKQPAGSEAMRFDLVPADTTPAIPGRPGQYVSVRLAMPDGVRQARQYSLCAQAESKERRVLTVKADKNGEVSQHLHQRIQTGDVVELSSPAGDIELVEASTPLVLISAGIGCTPMAAVLDSLARRGSQRPVLVFHAERRYDSWALAEQMCADIRALPQARLELWLEQTADAPHCAQAVHAGRMNLAEARLDRRSAVYLCGPLPFMRQLREQVLAQGIPGRNIHYEVFGPDLWLAQSLPESVNQ